MTSVSACRTVYTLFLDFWITKDYEVYYVHTEDVVLLYSEQQACGRHAHVLSWLYVGVVCRRLSWR